MNEIALPNGQDKNKKPTTEITKCRQCLQEIEDDAKICYHCGSNQNPLWQIVKIVPLVMVALTVVQLGLVVKERVETSQILDEVENIKKQAVGMMSDVEKTKSQATDTLEKVEEREKLVSERLVNAQKQITLIEQRLNIAETEFRNQQHKLSEKIAKVSNDAETMIEESNKKINNQVIKSNERLQKAENKFNNKSSKLTDELHGLKDEVSIELEKLKWRDQLMMLTDEAISDGKRSSFNELKKLLENHKGTDKEFIVTSQILQVKKFYIGINRFKGKYIIKNEKKILTKDISTEKAIKELAQNNSAAVRFLLAAELGKRKQIGVPEALLFSAMNDECLDVVARCIKSYDSITEYDSPDVLDYKHIEEHWHNNKDEIIKKLKPQTSEKQDEAGDN